MLRGAKTALTPQPPLPRGEGEQDSIFSYSPLPQGEGLGVRVLEYFHATSAMSFETKKKLTK
jgi:hypothetical protein